MADDGRTTSPAGGGLRKQRGRPFLQVPSSTVRDRRLSFRARGVLAWLLDQPDGWDVRAAVIAGHGTEGRDAVEAALRELRAAGYYRLERRRLPGGTWTMGTAVAEEADPAWAASHLEHDGRAIPVVVDLAGNVTELEPSAPETGFQGPADQAPAGPAPVDPSPVSPSPTQTDTQTETVGELVGDVTSATPPTLERPRPTPHDTHDARIACGICAADRRALKAYEDAVVADAKDAARAALELGRIRRAEQRADSELDVELCGYCDDAGIAPVHVGDDVVTTICQHDPDANRRAVEARLAIRATLAARFPLPSTTDTPEA